MTASPRVLCYAPYNRWALHGQWEMTMLHAAQLRGADVHYVLCDGLYTDCDVFWQATEPRPARACVGCQAEVTSLVHRMGMDFTWLGRYLTLDERREARGWAAGLAASELATARYGDWDVAEWITSSVHSHFRASALDLAEPATQAAFRSYLFSGLVACFALDRLLEDHAPDVLLTFNGRQSSTRVALKLARRRGIRVVCHERGPRAETLMLTVDENCMTLDLLRDFWRDWGEVPLRREELEAVVGHLHAREHGIGLPWKTYTPPPQPADEVRAALGLRPDRPTWVLFTSSDDEVAAEASYQGDFATQLEWIERTVEHVAGRPEVDLVIRVHPNTGSRRSTGANQAQLTELDALRGRLPANVRMVEATDDVSSYTLMDLATVGLVYHSTAGLELACKGKETVVAAGCIVGGTPFVRTVARADGYGALLDELVALPAGASSPEIARLALRFAYGAFFRTAVDFPLVRMPSPSLGELAWRATHELAPGREPGLDRSVRILLDGEPTCLPPTDAERARSEEEELAWFGDTPPAHFTALAFAEELIADVSLLRTWAATFPADPATLVIETPSEAMERLIDAVGLAGLDADDAPDLLAVDPETGVIGPVDAVFSRGPATGVGAPRFDDASAAALREFALARLA